MSSQDKSITEVTEIISDVEFSLESYKVQINLLEEERISNLIKVLESDVDRLNRCIENIEFLHRNMFILPYAKAKLSNTDNESSVKDAEYSVTEPNPSENEPVCIRNVSEPYEDELYLYMNQPDCLMNQPDCLMNQPDCLMNQPDCLMNQPDCLMNQPDLRQDERDLWIQKPDCSMNEQTTSRERLMNILESFFRRHTYNNESNYSKYETVNLKDESSNGSDESIDKYELSNVEKEFSKQIVLDSLADKEKKLSKLVLKLMLAFSRFQHKLQDVKKSEYVSTSHFPSGSYLELKKNLEDLSESVLKLDKDVYEINKEYSKCLNTE